MENVMEGLLRPEVLLFFHDLLYVVHENHTYPGQDGDNQDHVGLM